MNWITRSRLADDLARLGISDGDVVMVHAGMRSVGPLLGGPDLLIVALLDAIGESGTVMAYTDWESGVRHLTRDDSPESVPQEVLDELPPFDPASSRARRKYGVLPEFLRTWPGAVRSSNPDASVCAVGARAAWLCADHPMQYGYGPGSPFAKLVEAQGRVLLAGAPLNSLTLLHHSEHMAKLPSKRVIHYREPVLVDGRKVWIDIEEFDTSNPVVPTAWEDYFTDIAKEFLASGAGRTSKIGNGDSYLFDAAELHQFAVDWMESEFG